MIYHYGAIEAVELEWDIRMNAGEWSHDESIVVHNIKNQIKRNLR